LGAVLLLLVPASAAAAGPRQAAAASPPPLAAPGEAAWRTPDPQNVLVIDTTKGRIVVEMAPAAAPLHVARIRALAKTGFYDGRAFFRVIADFMDQTGDPTDTGTGGSTLPNLPAEFTFRRVAETPIVVVSREGGLEAGFLGSLPVIGQPMDLGLLTADHRVNAWGAFCSGVGGMARADAPDSANSQFFLMRATVASLDQKYTAWGRAISGLDVIRAIATGEPPAAPDKVLTVRLLADLPAATAPRVRVIDTRGAWFTAMAARVRAEKVVGVSPCDFDLPSDIR
ncbi:MAG: peptidylprolyl isomerase, partial [Caulobacteraceae bacterium]